MVLTQGQPHGLRHPYSSHKDVDWARSTIDPVTHVAILSNKAELDMTPLLSERALYPEKILAFFQFQERLRMWILECEFKPKQYGAPEFAISVGNHQVECKAFSGHWQILFPGTNASIHSATVDQYALPGKTHSYSGSKGWSPDDMKLFVEFFDEICDLMIQLDKKKEDLLTKANTLHEDIRSVTAGYRLLTTLKS
jgi:hypothetical protein